MLHLVLFFIRLSLKICDMHANLCVVSTLTSLCFRYALEKNGSPKPLFEMDPERVSFSATIFIHQAFLENGPINETINETINQLETIEKTVLQCFLANSYSSIVDVSTSINKSRATVSRIVADLKKKGLLYHVGARKNGRWVVSDKITKHLK